MLTWDKGQVYVQRNVDIHASIGELLPVPLDGGRAAERLLLECKLK